MEHQSEITFEAKCAAGVRYTIGRMSFGRRLELTRRIWELAGRAEFNGGGAETAEKLEAALLEGEIDRTYVEWGLLRLEGLTIDGQTATPGLLMAQGPEHLCREIVAAIKAECGLNEEERKNF
jgi:hypothetical protein